MALVGGYASSIAITAIVGVAIIPVIILKSGEAGWAAIAVGQSTGSIAAVVVALGWTITGPAQIARASLRERKQIVANSVVARIWLSILVVPALIAATYQLTPQHGVASVLAAVNVGSIGLGLSWYFVGIGSPRKLLLFDTLPRAVGTVLGGIVLWLSGSLIALTGIQVASGLVAALISIRFAANRCDHGPRWIWSMKWSLKLIKDQLFPSTTALANATYAALPTLAVAWWAPGGIAVFALGERLGRYVTMSVTPMHSWMQGWVPRAELPSQLRRRIRGVVLTAIVAGLLAGIGLTFVGPVLGGILSGGSLSVGFELIAAIAVAIGMSTISRCTGPACLVSIGGERAVAYSTFCGAIVCILVLALLVPTQGALGAAYAMAASETVVAAVQGFVLSKMLKRMVPRGRRSTAIQ